MDYLKANKNIVSRLKILFFDIILVLPLIMLGIILFLEIVNFNSICYSKKDNIIDDYGNLREKESEIIEASLKNVMKSKKYNFYFAYVYEDINQKYAKSFSKKSIIIYYNANTSNLKVISNSVDLKGKENKIVTLENNEQLLDKFPEYIKNITEQLKPRYNIYYNSPFQRVLGFFSLLLILIIILFLIPISYNYFEPKKYKEIEMISNENFSTSEKNNLENLDDAD